MRPCSHSQLVSCVKAGGRQWPGLQCANPCPSYSYPARGASQCWCHTRPARCMLRCLSVVCAGVGAHACAGTHTAPAHMHAAPKGKPGDRLGPQAGAAACSASAPSPLPHGLLPLPPTAGEVPFEAWQVHVEGNAVTLGHMTPVRPQLP